MRNLIYWIHSSVDGYINGPQGEFDWPVMSDELAAYSDAMNEGVDTLMYGRKVWELMSSFWPNAEQIDDSPHTLKFAPFWRAAPKVIVSRTIETTDWNSRVISGNVAEEVAALKAQPGKDILLTGGSDLAASLTEHGLIDDYRIVVHPVVLGGGAPLFLPPKDRINLRLVDSRTFDSRAVLLRYEIPSKTA
jgi:dihydrofolate reductase